MRSYCHNAICVMLVICSKSRPDDGGDDDDDDDDADNDDDSDNPIGSKHVAVRIIYKFVFNDYLFTPYFIF